MKICNKKNYDDTLAVQLIELHTPNVVEDTNFYESSSDEVP